MKFFKEWLYSYSNILFSQERQWYDTLDNKIKKQFLQHQPQSFPKRPLLSCARFTCDNFFLLLLNNEEVEKLRCKLSGYMYGRYTLDTLWGFTSQVTLTRFGLGGLIGSVPPWSN